MAWSRRFMSQWKERPRVLQAAWPDVQLVDRVTDLSNATLPQIVEKGPHVRIWIVGASSPSNLLTAHQEIPRLVSLLKVLDAQVAFVAECASNIDVEIRDSVSRALNVKLIEVCSSSRCPMGRPRLYWLSWQLTAIDHFSVQCAKRVDVLVFPAV